MRLLLLGPANSVHMQRWANGLSQRGHRVLLLSQHAPVPDLPLDNGVDLELLPYANGLGYFLNAWAAKKVTKHFRPDILHAHYASGYGTLARLVGFHPTLLSVWGSDIMAFPSQPIKRWLLSQNLHFADYLAATGEALQVACQNFVGKEKRITITPFGIDTQHFSPTTAKIKNHPLRIGVLKYLQPVYGIDLLLQAFALARQEGLCNNAELWILGDGPERENLEKLAKSLEISEQVYFKGLIPHAQAPQYLRQLDIFCLLSQQEGFGVSALEAAACGLPVIASKVGGLPEVVLDGHTGCLVEPGSVQAAAQQIRRLAEDPQRRAEWGTQGRAHVLQNYSWEQSLTRMEALYFQILRPA
jgi:L-malate glycosyltransferase